jgi:hypothetical protein
LRAARIKLKIKNEELKIAGGSGFYSDFLIFNSSFLIQTNGFHRTDCAGAA